MISENKIRVLASEEPIKVARAVRDYVYTGKNRKPTLWYGLGSFWWWDGDKWVQKSRKDVEDEAWLFLEDVHIQKTQDSTDRYKPTARNVEEVVRGMEVVGKLPMDALPMWLKKGQCPDVGGLVAFEDVIVDIYASAATGGVVTYPRTEEWLDTVVIPGKWEDKLECPVWERCLREWKEHEEGREMLERSCGYFLQPEKKYPYWWLFMGVPRSGKSTVVRVVKGMLGKPAFKSTDVGSMGGSFGLDGFPSARVIVVNEVYELEGKQGERVGSLVKQVLGQDEVTVDVKYERATTQQINAAVVMVSNEIPRLPNKGRGLSSKIKPVVFNRSFEGNPDLGLERKLLRELGGIGRRWVEAAIRLEQETQWEKKFVLDAEGKEAVYRYHVLNNPLDEFLEWGFVKNQEGMVEKGMIGRMFEQFAREFKVKLNVPPSQVAWKLCADSSWVLQEVRPHGDVRMIKGLSLRAKETVAHHDDE